MAAPRVSNSALHAMIQDVLSATDCLPVELFDKYRFPPRGIALRQLTTWILRKATGVGSMPIGRALDRDHATVLHNVKEWEAKMAANPGLAKGSRTLLTAIIVRATLRKAAKPLPPLPSVRDLVEVVSRRIPDPGYYSQEEQELSDVAWHNGSDETARSFFAKQEARAQAHIARALALEAKERQQ